MINILGTEYTIETRRYDEDPLFKKNSCDGYCDDILKKIVLCDMHTWPGYENETEEYIAQVRKQSLRHEIVHAFYNESGLLENALHVDGSWARNEEMVDWIAIQGPKIYSAWQIANAV